VLESLLDLRDASMFKKILIANRGEIAIRILRACRELGVGAVAVFSEADRASLHVRLADEAYPIGPSPSRESYLRIDKLMDVARRADCDALHPGYGFLAENPELARACLAAGITFIGPAAEAMEQMGSKTAARQLARRAGVPTVPGVVEPIEGLEKASQLARGTGFPPARPSCPRRGAMPARKRSTLSATRGCILRNISTGRGTLKSKSSPTSMATSSTLASANVPCSGVTKK